MGGASVEGAGVTAPGAGLPPAVQGQVRTNPDGSVTEIPPERCPNGHELTYPNVIVAHRPKPGTGRLTRAWHCLTCNRTIYDD
jgi:hypothetical protein